MNNPRGARYQPQRGDLISLDFSPQAGNEISGRRPALVVSPHDFNLATGQAWVCPITNQMKGGRFEVALPPRSKVTGVVLADQLRSVDWLARNAAFVMGAPNELVIEVLARIEAVLSPLDD